MIRALPPFAVAATGAVAALLISLAAVVSLLTAPAAQAQTTREQVIAFLGEVENQIERIATAQGRFMQISDAGQIVRGDIYIARPGRMRFDYDDPSPALLVADGRFIGTYNTKDETSAHRQINQTPLKFLLNAIQRSSRVQVQASRWMSSGRLSPETAPPISWGAIVMV